MCVRERERDKERKKRYISDKKRRVRHEKKLAHSLKRERNE
jgi:hypothetical protein